MGVRPAVLALVRAVLIIRFQEGIKIGLDFIKRTINLFPERYAVKLIEDRLVESFRTPLGLRMPGFGAAVLDVVEVEV